MTPEADEALPMQRSKLLLAGESQRCLQPAIAHCFGVSAALLLQQIHYRLDRTNHWIANEPWVYNTVEDWVHDLDGLFSARTIKRDLALLKRHGVLKSAYHMPHKSERIGKIKPFFSPRTATQPHASAPSLAAIAAAPARSGSEPQPGGARQSAAVGYNFTGGQAGNDYENELILPRGSTFRITKAVDMGEYRLFYVDYLPPTGKRKLQV